MALEIMESSIGNSYVFMDQKMSDVTYTEKPGVSSLAALRIRSKTVLVQGGFDQRVRLISAKSLKLLVNLPFHKGIVNKVYIEESEDQEGKAISKATMVDVYSVSEDGNLAHWRLEV